MCPRGSNVRLCLVYHVSALSAQVHHVPSPGLCPLVAIACLLHRHSFWLPNSAFASAPYARKTVWGLCWYNVGSLFKKIGWPRYALAASRILSALCLACVHHVSAMCAPRVRLVSALCLPQVWPRLQTFSAMGPLCPPCVRPCVHFGRASNLVCNVSALPFVRHVSESPPNFVRRVLAMWPALNPLSPDFVRHVCAMLCWPVSTCVPLCPGLQTLSAMWPPCHVSTMCPLKPALPLDFVGSRPAVASSAEILSHRCPTHSVYMACTLASFLHIHFGSPSSAFASDPAKLFGVHAGKIYLFQSFGDPLQTFSMLQVFICATSLLVFLVVSAYHSAVLGWRTDFLFHTLQCQCDVH